tara:strand:- start:45 stop:551 length:507 start_codon:yes stop_codon:yes gene_type:complete
MPFIADSLCGVCHRNAYHQNYWYCSQGLIGPKIKEWFDYNEEGESQKCIYHNTCGNDADYKTMNGKIDGDKSEDWGKLGYGNNHLYHWNLCGVCHKKECGEDTDTDDEYEIEYDDMLEYGDMLDEDTYGRGSWDECFPTKESAIARLKELQAQKHGCKVSGCGCGTVD